MFKDHMRAEEKSFLWEGVAGNLSMVVFFLDGICVGRVEESIAATESGEDKGLAVGKRKACSVKEVTLKYISDEKCKSLEEEWQQLGWSGKV